MLQNSEVSSRRRGRFYAYAPVVLWAVVILFLGSGAGASAQTSRFIKPFIEFFFPNAAPDTFLLVHGLIRKTAHFVEYGILAFLAARAFSESSKEVLRNYWPLFSLTVVLAVAGVDEANQNLNSSRTGSGWDVALDTTGGLFGLLLFWLFRNRKAGASRPS